MNFNDASFRSYIGQMPIHKRLPQWLSNHTANRYNNAARCLTCFPLAYLKILSQKSKGRGQLLSCWRGTYVEMVKVGVAHGSLQKLASLCIQRL